MINSITNFTDRYGMTHSDPVFIIKTAACTEAKSDVANYDLISHSYTTSTNNYINISYRVQYWPSKANLDQGDTPIDYFSPNGNSSFFFKLTTAPTDIIAAAENHFINKEYTND